MRPVELAPRRDLRGGKSIGAYVTSGVNAGIVFLRIVLTSREGASSAR